METLKAIVELCGRRRQRGAAEDVDLHSAHHGLLSSRTFIESWQHAETTLRLSDVGQ